MEMRSKVTARLRRTFAYPTDEDNETCPDFLDEQEQASLIASLSAQNARRNNRFRDLLVLLPLLSIIPFISVLFSSASSTTERPPRLFPIISLTSLLSTAYLVRRLSPVETGFMMLDARASLVSSSSSSIGAAAEGERVAASRRYYRAWKHNHNERGPLLKYLPVMNLLLAAVALVLGLLPGAARDQRWTAVLGNLPMGICIVLLVAKRVMAGVDPEKELGRLQYGYKGA